MEKIEYEMLLLLWKLGTDLATATIHLGTNNVVILRYREILQKSNPGSYDGMVSIIMIDCNMFIVGY